MFNGKRGQVTLFIVLGITILALIIASVFISRYFKPITPTSSFSSAVDDIKTQIDSCNKDTAKNSLIFLGAQGGRYKDLINPIDQENDMLGKVQLSHFVSYGGYVQFTLDDVEKEINSYYNDNLLECLDNFNEYRNQGYDIKSKIMNVDAVFEDEITLFNLNYELEITKAGKKETLNKYPQATVPYRFKKVFDVATEAAKLHASTGKIPVNYVLGNHISLMNYDVKSSIIYRLTDNKNDPERKYVFYFAVN